MTGWKRRVDVFLLAEWLDASMVPMTMVVWNQCLLEELVSLSF